MVKRRGKKGRKRNGRACAVRANPWLGQGLPRQMKAVMRYAFNDTITLNAGNSYMYDWSFRGNSLYDPDATGVGGQPTTYDQWCGFYGYYKCDKSVMTVKFNTPELATTQPQINVVLFPHVSSNPGADVIGLLGPCKGVQHRVINLYVTDVSMVCRCSNAAMYPELSTTNNNFVAASNANPAFEWYYHICLDGSQVAADQDVLVVGYVDYHATMIRPGVLDPS
jgi:hypothetical protein